MNAWDALDALELHAAAARDALGDEAEGRFRDQVASIAAIARELDRLVRTW